MLLSFAACGGEATGKVNLEELLVAEKWINVYNRYDFLEFDSMDIGKNENGYKWEVVDNSSVKTMVSSLFAGDSTLSYRLVEYEGVNALYDSETKTYYIPESLYDGVRENLVFPTYIAYGTISMKDGSEEVLTADELYEIYDSNLTKYVDYYDERKVTVIGEITEIGTSSVRIGEYGNRWAIKTLNQTHDLSKFEVGDVVIATGTIQTVSGAEVDVDVNTDTYEVTTLKHYEG